MNKWFEMALVAYSIGAVIEGVGAARELVHSVPSMSDRANERASNSNDSPSRWQILTAIATVSLCGAFSWPCRLVHRSLKESQPQPDEDA